MALYHMYILYILYNILYVSQSTFTICHLILHVLCTAPSPPRDLTITRVFQHGIELNWIPPRETNGDIQHYIIKYTTQDGTEQEINTTDNTNYYNLTGLERGQTYNIIRVIAVNSAGTSEGSGAIASYTHNPSKSTGIIIQIHRVGRKFLRVQILTCIRCFIQSHLIHSTLA